MSLDPSQNSAVFAALQARVLSAFPAIEPAVSVTVSPPGTPRVSGDHPMQASFAPVTGSRVAVAWQARYRNYRFEPRTIVVDARLQDLGVALALDDAQRCFDLLDARYLSGGVGVPNGAHGVPAWVPPSAGPYYDPLRQGDARWVNDPAPPRRAG